MNKLSHLEYIKIREEALNNLIQTYNELYTEKCEIAGNNKEYQFAILNNIKSIQIEALEKAYAQMVIKLNLLGAEDINLPSKSLKSPPESFRKT